MSVTIGVDIGGTKIAAGVVSATGEILARARRDTPAQDPDQIAHDVAALVAELAADAHRRRAVGVACAGFIDRTGSTVLFAPNLAWRDEPLKMRLEALVDHPVTIENDANAAAWGEFRFGAATEADDMVLVTVGTGIGGGVVVDSRLLRGAFGIGGELGHMRVVPDGIRCGCGNRGCWEVYASGNALRARGPRARGLRRPAAARPSPRPAAATRRALKGTTSPPPPRPATPPPIELLADLGRWVGRGRGLGLGDPRPRAHRHRWRRRRGR